jgi:Tol biopolymer transport system component
MTYLPAGGLIFSAITAGQPALFKVNQIGDVQSLNLRGTRYPSVSPDGQWLAYSELQRGNWNLWLLNLGSGQRQRLTHAACNNTEPTWTSDSQTLIYASDCGRALWFSALCRLRINH